MKITNKKYLVVFVLILLVINCDSVKSQIPVRLDLCIRQSCFNLVPGASWEARLLTWNQEETGIRIDGVTTTDCVSINTTDLKAGKYYWTIDSNPPYYSCWGEPFSINPEGGIFVYNFECSPISNCLRAFNKPNSSENLFESKAFDLSQNYPNPFNPSTVISYQIPKTTYVNLTVYNLLGEEIRVLVNEIQNQGLYNVNFDGNELSSGVYVYKLHAGEFTSTKKMFLVK